MKKFLGLSMVAGAALLVSACNTQPAAENVAFETENVTDSNGTDDLASDNLAAADNLTADNATVTENAADNATAK